ncbi:MAG: 30S ribosomal protein S6 [bacterium]|nr:30S ribosomal protein S6 [bacterium]
MAEMSHAEGNSEASSQASEGSERSVYEVGFHIVPTVAEAEIGSVLEKLRAALAKGDAEIIKEEFPAKKTLAYMIERSLTGKREKYTESYFGFIKFAMDKAKVAEFTATLRATSEILRFLVIETVREEAVVPRRAVFSSDRLEGETIKKPTTVPEASREISEEELNKSIDALTLGN